jgi:O-antigen ligase
MFVILSELSATWLVLLFLGLGFVAVVFWSGNPKDFLFVGMMLTCSIDINKVIIAKGGVYVPGLSITLMDVFFLPLFGIWLFEKLVINRQRLRWNKIYLLPFLYILWCWLSVANAEDKLPSVLLCINYTRYFLIFILIADFINQPRHLRLALYGLGGAIALHLVFVILQIASSGAFEIQGTKTTVAGTKLIFANAGGMHVYRPSGFMGHPNALADYLVFILPLLFSLALMGIKRLGRPIWFATLVFFVLGVATIVLTLSRGGWISFAFAIFFVLGFGYLRGIVSVQLISRLTLLGVVGMICVVIAFPAALLRMTESDNRSTESRFAMMDNAFLVIERNLLTGVGVGGYREAAKDNIPQSFAYLNPWYQEQLLKGVVHNKYLLTMAETGLIGIIIFMLMLFSFITVAVRFKYWTDPVYFALGLGFSAGIFGQLIFYAFDHFYGDARVTLLFVYFGLVAATIKLQEIQIRQLATQGSP